MELMLHVHNKGETLVISGQGRVVRGPESEALEAALLHMLSTHSHVVLDLTSVPRIDCSAIGVIASACAKARQEGKCLELCGVCPLIREMIDCVGLHDVVAVQDEEGKNSVAA